MFMEVLSVVLLVVGCVNLGFAIGVWKGTEDMTRMMKKQEEKGDK